MKKQTIRHLVKKSAEGRYYSIEFDVPEGVSSITVEYRYPRIARGGVPNLNIVDLGLEDERGRFLGWSGSARKRVTVGEYDATPGYNMTPVRPGKWKILIGAYRIQPGGVPVIYTITFEEKRAQWLFGDLHVHSDASDGEYDIPTLAKMAKRQGLDFLSVTNHNNYAANLSLPQIPGLTLIPGVEWTHYKGHMNFYGVAQPFSNSFLANSESEMQCIIQQARQAGALISVNHPKCNLCPYLWQDDRCFDMMEIWNGPMRRVNINGIAWWTSLLSEGRKIPAVGGSDFHRSGQTVRLGHPVTAVYSSSRSAADILDAILHGHSYITSGINGVRLSLQCEGRSFGDSVSENGTHTVLFSAEKMPRGSRLELICDKGKLAYAAARNGCAKGRADVKGVRFVYLLASLSMTPFGRYPLAVSNPIYFDKEEASPWNRSNG